MDENQKEKLWPDPDHAKQIAAAVAMGEEQKEELWRRFSTVWRNVLTRVLEWPEERVDQYIEELRRQMEASFKDPLLDVFGFFYDLPSRYLWSPLLSGELYEKTKGNEANPHLIYQRLTHAIAGSHLEREMEKPDFDWNQARQRYQTERRKIEEWLATQDSNDKGTS
jgi:hypothetical protein